MLRMLAIAAFLLGLPGHAEASASALRAELDVVKAFRAAQRIVNPRYDADDGHGFAIALSGTRALIGAPAFEGSGAVYAFELSGGVWDYRQTLLPPRTNPEAGFGWSLAMTGNVALVGAIGGDADVAGQGYVVAYAFVNGRWEPEAELSLPDGATSDQFGISVALSGSTAVIGATGANAGSAVDAGGAYVFVRSGTSWTEQARLFASDATALDQFGFDVAVSGASAVVGARRDEISGRPQQGSAYVFVRNAGVWTQQAKLTSSDSAAQDQFGTSIAIDGDTALIGAPYDDIATSVDQGSAYVYVRAGTTWSLQQKLVNVDGTPTDRSLDGTGLTVALQGDTALLAAPGIDGVAGTNCGAVISFTRSGTSWARRDQLENTHPASERLGFALALAGDVALATTLSLDTLGNPDTNVVHAWERSGLSWTAPEVFRGSAASLDAFGYSVAQSGDTALVGAFGTDVRGVDTAGTVYVYRRGPGGWALDTVLRPSDPLESGFFGFALALDATHAYVSAPFAAAGAIANAGAVYVFERSAGWPQRAKLQPLDVGSDGFGYSLALEGTTLHVGAPLDVVGGVLRGSVVTYARSGDVWTEGAKIVAPDGVANDGFGYAVAARDELLLVGAPFLDFTLGNSGSAHLFTRSAGAWVRTQRYEVTDPVDANYFGASVALAPDAAFVGAPLQDVAMLPARGAAFVSSRTASGWSLPSELSNSASEDTATIGTSLAWSNGILLVGGSAIFAAGDSVGESSVYRYQLTGNGYLEDARLRPPGEPNGSGYGASIAWDGATAVVGEPVHNPFYGTFQVGAVHFIDEAGDALFAHGFEEP